MCRRARRVLGIGVGVLVMVAAVCAGATVVINEIAWGGTAASSSDEWIELFNATDEAIDLAGWTLVFGETTIHLGVVDGSTRELRGGVLDAEGYVLLERSDDETVADVAADVVYVGALSNTGITIELFDSAGQVVDRVDAADAGWAAGTGGGGELPYASMERLDPYAETAVWRSNTGDVRNGTDADGGTINGTPGRENGARILARTAPRVELLGPVVEGEALRGIAMVSWSAVDPDGAAEALRVSIELSTDGGDSWSVLVENLANGGSYAWDTTLHPDGDDIVLRVVSIDPDGYRGTAESPKVAIANGG